MTIAQPDFAAALRDPDLPAPAGLTDPAGRPAGKRFDVYRNNVAHSLTDALETAFPVVLRLVGRDFFRAMAGIYLRRHPPRSPRLMFYGREMPAFLDSFPPVAHLGYLPDIARLELALRGSYHAADAAPVGPEALQALPPDRLLHTRLCLAPALRLVRSAWPIHGVWRANTDPAAPKPGRTAEDVLITRPEFDPVLTLLPPGGAAFVAALRDGATLAAAHEGAEAEAPGFNPTDTLAALISGGAITGFQEETP